MVAAAPDEGRAWAQTQLRDGTKGADVAVITGGGPTQVLIDGSQLFSAQAALAALAAVREKALAARASGSPVQRPQVTVLYNPGLKTSDIMIPGLCGVVLVFIGTIITSLGVVRERQSGTLEQLAVMPLRPRDVFLGKIVPYFVVAASTSRSCSRSASPSSACRSAAPTPCSGSARCCSCSSRWASAC